MIKTLLLFITTFNFAFLTSAQIDFPKDSLFTDTLQLLFSKYRDRQGRLWDSPYFIYYREGHLQLSGFSISMNQSLGGSFEPTDYHSVGRSDTSEFLIIPTKQHTYEIHRIMETNELMVKRIDNYTKKYYLYYNQIDIPHDADIRVFDPASVGWLEYDQSSYLIRNKPNKIQMRGNLMNSNLNEVHAIGATITKSSHEWTVTNIHQDIVNILVINPYGDTVASRKFQVLDADSSFNINNYDTTWYNSTERYVIYRNINQYKNGKSTVILNSSRDHILRIEGSYFTSKTFEVTVENADIKRINSRIYKLFNLVPGKLEVKVIVNKERGKRDSLTRKIKVK